MNPDDLIATLLMRQQAPAGSPAATVADRFAPMDDALRSGDAYTIDATSGSPVIDLSPDYYSSLDKYTRPEGVDAFLESGPMSENIEDRRGEDVMDFIRQYMSSIEGR